MASRHALQDQYDAIILVNPPDDSGPLTAEAVLVPDRKRAIHILGPDGMPVAAVAVHNSAGPFGYESLEATKTPGVMTISRLNPMRPKRLHLPPRRKEAGGIAHRPRR